jgi:putative alpha-1,2-mannosidase
VQSAVSLRWAVEFKCYDDYCAATLAIAAGRGNEADGFRKSAMNCTNVFDGTTRFMRGRRDNGFWVKPFDPVEWGGPFTEGNAWQWTWSVMHDPPGLVRLMGGERAFCDNLDAMFDAGSAVKVGTFGTMIHEMN